MPAGAPTQHSTTFNLLGDAASLSISIFFTLISLGIIRHNHFNKVHESPISSSISILLLVMHDGLPSVNFMFLSFECLPSLKS